MGILKSTQRRLKAKSRHLRSKLGLYESKYSTSRNIDDVEKGLAAVKTVLACDNDEFNSKDFMLDTLLSFGLSNTTASWSQMERFEKWRNKTLFGTLQYPTEFIDFLMDCARCKPESICEIGAYTGGSSYFAAAVFQRANPQMTYSMIDISDKLIGFEVFSQVLNLDKRVPSTATDHRGEKFDMVFVDADHSYAGARLDYEALGQHAEKLIGFHDIHGHEYDDLDGGIVRFWNEVKEKHAMGDRIVEYAHSPERWMGIGLIDRT